MEDVRPGGFAGLKIMEAEFREVVQVALIELLEWRVRILHFIVAARHVFGIVIRVGDQRTSLRADADTKLSRGGFVVGIREAAADAGAVG